MRQPVPGNPAGQEIQAPPLMNVVMDRLLALEAPVVRHGDLPCGNSLLAMARKPGAGAQ